MLQNGEVLSVVNIKKLDPGVVPRVTPEELAKRSRYDFVKVSFPLDWMMAETAAEELKPMISPNGKLNALKEHQPAGSDGRGDQPPRHLRSAQGGAIRQRRKSGWCASLCSQHARAQRCASSSSTSCWASKTKRPQRPADARSRCSSNSSRR